MGATDDLLKSLKGGGGSTPAPKLPAGGGGGATDALLSSLRGGTAAPAKKQGGLFGFKLPFLHTTVGIHTDAKNPLTQGLNAVKGAGPGLVRLGGSLVSEGAHIQQHNAQERGNVAGLLPGLSGLGLLQNVFRPQDRRFIKEKAPLTYQLGTSPIRTARQIPDTAIGSLEPGVGFGKTDLGKQVREEGVLGTGLAKVADISMLAGGVGLLGKGAGVGRLARAGELENAVRATAEGAKLGAGADAVKLSRAALAADAAGDTVKAQDLFRAVGQLHEAQGLRAAVEGSGRGVQAAERATALATRGGHAFGRVAAAPFVPTEKALGLAGKGLSAAAKLDRVAPYVEKAQGALERSAQKRLAGDMYHERVRAPYQGKMHEVFQRHGLEDLARKMSYDEQAAVSLANKSYEGLTPGARAALDRIEKLPEEVRPDMIREAFPDGSVTPKQYRLAKDFQDGKLPEKQRAKMQKASDALSAMQKNREENVYVTGKGTSHPLSEAALEARRQRAAGESADMDVANVVERKTFATRSRLANIEDEANTIAQTPAEAAPTSRAQERRLAAAAERTRRADLTASGEQARGERTMSRASQIIEKNQRAAANRTGQVMGRARERLAERDQLDTGVARRRAAAETKSRRLNAEGAAAEERASELPAPKTATEAFVPQPGAKRQGRTGVNVGRRSTEELQAWQKSRGLAGAEEPPARITLPDGRTMTPEEARPIIKRRIQEVMDDINERADVATATTPAGLGRDSWKNTVLGEKAEVRPVAEIRKYAHQPLARSGPAFEALKADIAEHGFNEPVILHYNAETGKVWLGEGNHRLAAAEALGIKDIPVVLEPQAAVSEYGATAVKAKAHEPLNGPVSPSTVLPDAPAPKLSAKARAESDAAAKYHAADEAAAEAGRLKGVKEPRTRGEVQSDISRDSRLANEKSAAENGTANRILGKQADEQRSAVERAQKRLDAAQSAEAAAKDRFERENQVRGERAQDKRLAQLDRQHAAALDRLAKEEEAARNSVEAAPPQDRPALLVNQRIKSKMLELAEAHPEHAAEFKALADDIETTKAQLDKAGVKTEYFFGGKAEERHVSPAGTAKLQGARRLQSERNRITGTLQRDIKGQTEKYARETLDVLHNEYRGHIHEELGSTVRDELGMAREGRLAGPAGRHQPEFNPPGEDLAAALDQRKLVAWDPATGKALDAKDITPQSAVLDKHVFEAQKKYTAHRDPNMALRVYDKATGLWKHSVLALSPRWHVGNIVGNAALATLGAGLTPAQIIATNGEARRLVKAFEKGGDIPAGDVASMERLIAAGFHNPDLATVEGTTKIGRLIGKSYEFNEYVDSVNRTMVYLAKKNEGYSSEAAVQLALKAAGDFTKMTPFERNVVRRVIPFYAWQRHITRLAFSLPVEAPARVAWTLHLADLENRLHPDPGADNPFNEGTIPLPGGKRLNVSQFYPIGSSFWLDPTFRGAGYQFNPVLKAAVAGGTGFNLGKMKPVSAKENAGGFGASPEVLAAKHPGVFAQFLAQQFPQVGTARDLLTDNAPVRYDTGQPRKVGKGATKKTAKPTLTGRNQLNTLARLLGIPLPEPEQKASTKAKSKK